MLCNPRGPPAWPSLALREHDRVVLLCAPPGSMALRQRLEVVVIGELDRVERRRLLIIELLDRVGPVAPVGRRVAATVAQRDREGACGCGLHAVVVGGWWASWKKRNRQSEICGIMVPTPPKIIKCLLT